MGPPVRPWPGHAHHRGWIERLPLALGLVPAALHAGRLPFQPHRRDTPCGKTARRASPPERRACHRATAPGIHGGALSLAAMVPRGIPRHDARAPMARPERPGHTLALVALLPARAAC